LHGLGVAGGAGNDLFVGRILFSAAGVARSWDSIPPLNIAARSYGQIPCSSHRSKLLLTILSP
jgi:hypothetical protein